MEGKKVNSGDQAFGGASCTYIGRLINSLPDNLQRRNYPGRGGAYMRGADFTLYTAPRRSSFSLPDKAIWRSSTDKGKVRTDEAVKQSILPYFLNTILNQ
jgi:hypothetical protein